MNDTAWRGLLGGGEQDEIAWPFGKPSPGPRGHSPGGDGGSPRTALSGDGSAGSG